MKLTPLACAVALLGLNTAAMAQNASAPQRVEITGSSIKRIDAETALPIQIIKAEELERAGISSAEQLLSILSANGNGVDSMVTNQGGDFLNSLLYSGRGANNGAASASLRGLGPQNTLVLLNGRRVSTHGLNGKSVDLNSIPMAAIDRIEVLRDGASAIYGTDAIGGVMNFILRKDYRGLEASAFADTTQAGGGNIYSGKILFGTGSLDDKGFNLMASLSMDRQERLRGAERSFHNGYQPSRGLAMDTTGTPFATINAASGTALGASFKLPGDATTYNRVNLLALQGKCDSIPNTYAYRGDITGFNNNNKSCAYDYGKDWSLQQPVERLNFVGRGLFKLGKDHTASIEVTASQVTSDAQYTANQITSVARGANYPVGGPYYLNLATAMPTLFKSTNTDPTDTRVFFDATKPIRLRWRCLECGLREQETRTDTYRAVLGLDGVFAGWDYRLGLSSAGSKASTNYLDGYLVESKFKAAMDTGLINPFLLPGQSQTKAAMDLIEGAKYRGPLYGGEAKLSQLDAVFSRDLMQLPAGPLSMAAGADIRQETYKFSDGTVGAPALIGAGSPATLPKASRDIRAVFGELQVPIVKTLDAQLAVRHDSYSDFGSTTNPKVALRWQPAKAFLVRGSYNTGFHAPDFGPLYEGANTGQFNSDVNDPVFCAQYPGDVRFCKIRPVTITGGNPNLKPEKSKQWSVGFVAAPTAWLSASVDVFQIDLSDRIAVRTPQEVLANYQTLSEYIVRKAPDAKGAAEIDFVRAGWINVAGDKVSGADLNLTFNVNSSMGRFTGKLDGTYLTSYKVRKDANSPWVERVGEFGDFNYLWDLKLRWKHNASVTWSRGDWSATLSQDYKSGYKSEVDGYGGGVILQDKGFPSKVSSYTLYNASVTWSGMKNLSLTAGVKNLFDTDPPFSFHNVDNVAGAGWDARVGDPRGRAFTFRANYKFF